MARDHARIHLDIWGDGQPMTIRALEVSGWSRPGWWVYTMYESGDRIAVPLYVGMTGQLYQRLSHHRRQRSWWPLVGDIVIESFSTHADACEAEERRILRLKPLLNITGNLHTPPWLGA